jgi:hypothetical protein
MSLTAIPPSSTTTTIPSILAVPISEKLTKSNYPLWSAQVLPAIHAAQLYDLLTSDEVSPAKKLSTEIDGKTIKQPNPMYTVWVAQGQAVLGYLLSTLTHETLMHVSRCATAAEVWQTLVDLYSSQMRARSVNACIALATTKKNQLSVSDYYAKMSHYADESAASGTPFCNDELVAYLLVGLDEEYNPVFTAVVAQINPISPSELYAQLLSFEQHTTIQAVAVSASTASAMTASDGRGSSVGHGGYGGSDRRHSRGRGRGRSSCGGFGHSGRGSSNTSRLHCQVCLKIGHTANKCWHRFEDYVPDSHAAAASWSSGIDNSWYMDFGATDHIMGDLDKLIMHAPYFSTDQVHAGNGTYMDITHIGKTIIPVSGHNFVLDKILHIPSTHKNLISVHRFTLDNDTFIEFHPYFFLIKDRKTRKMLLHRPCKGGLYPLPPASSKFQKLVFSAIKISADRWHSRLGHPACEIVCHVMSCL